MIFQQLLNLFSSIFENQSAAGYAIQLIKKEKPNQAICMQQVLFQKTANSIFHLQAIRAETE